MLTPVMMPLAEQETVFRWEWEKKKDVWLQYSKEIGKKIDENCSGTIEIEVGDFEFSLDFANMTQKNKRTRFQRKIRPTIKDANDGKFYAWEREDVKGHWKSFDKKSIEQLEAAFNGDKKSVKLELFNRSYSVDVILMEQENDVTGITRKVRREESKAAVEDSEETPVSIQVTRSTNGTKQEEKTAESFSEKGKRGASGKDTTEPVAKRAKSAKSEPSTSNGKSTKRKVVVKGRAPVDPECVKKLGKAHVYFEGNDVYDAMLNQTNIQNNNNKFYLIQLLEDDAAKVYSVWMRWGRVGVTGQSSLVSCGPDLEEAKRIFIKKFTDKTKNDWATRKTFEKVPGKYDLIKMDYAVEEKKEERTEKPSKVKKEPVESKLDARIQNLLQLICDLKAMAETMTEMEYDAEKLPLGKLTEAQIKAGFAALKLIETFIEKKDYGPKLVEACNAYYTRIPHVFGMRKPPLIRDKSALKKEIELMEALGDIEVAIRTLGKEEDCEKVNPIDRHYDSMKCELSPLEAASDEFKMVEKYMSNTHAPTHNLYKMKPRQVYVCNKDEEAERFNDVGNKVLLWHGSRLTNWYGILSKGLRIAPPEAPVTGYMFGKGIYFADVSSKSSNYCFATKQHNVGLVMLCEVALGKSQKLLEADYKADKLPPGINSTMGLGMLAPDPKEDFVMKGDCKVPTGTLIESGVENENGYTLNYNEYVVYDRAQVKMRYLVETEFQFK